MMHQGKSWVFGDNVDTDQLAPGAFMKSPMEELARHCLERLNPHFPKNVRAGDIVVGGRNFGAGSSREQAVQSLLQLGVSAVIAQSFGVLSNEMPSTLDCWYWNARTPLKFMKETI